MKKFPKDAKLMVFDWKRTLYDPENNSLIPGSLELLTFLKKQKLTLILVGKGGKEMHEKIKKLRVKDFFQTIIFTEEKNKNTYLKIINSNPNKVIFIGDRVRSELEEGNRLNAYTIWFKNGKFANETPLSQIQTPDLIVSSLVQLRLFLESGLKF